MPAIDIATNPTAAPTGQRLRSVWARAVAPLARMTRYHGVWGFGVNLLRNLPLRHKAWIVAVGVGLMLGLTLFEATRLRWQEWAVANDSLHGATEMRALNRLRLTALDVQRAAYLSDTDGAPGLIAPALALEQQAYDAERSLLTPLLSSQPQLQRAQALVDTRRSEMLARRDDAAAAPVAGRLSARLVASRRYTDATEPLRHELMLHWSSTLDSDAPTRLLRDGLVNAAGDLQGPLHRMLGQALASVGPQPPATYQRSLEDRLTEVRTVMALTRPSFDHARALLPDQTATLDGALQDIHSALALVQRLSQAGAGADASGIHVAGRAELNAHAQRAQAAADRIGALGLDAMQQRLQARVERLQRSAVIEGGLLLVCMLLTFYLLVCTYKVLAGGLNFLCHQVDELGRGNLGIRPNGHGQDEIGRALRVLGQSATQMASLFEAVTHGVAAVSHASRVVATGNAGLSERTAEIRASISSVSDSTQAFSGAMDRCNDAVDRASDHVRAMRGESQRCRKAMASLQERMRTLQRKSREIEQVVGMVEAVAYQTRLLAINASVEAARAGPAGKGFAVVAQEVRALATRSQGASQRIRDIIGSSIGEIDAGHQMSERLGQALVRSDTEVEAASGVIGQMVGLVRASQSQSVDVLNIARGVDEAIADNARLVQQLSAASAELRDEGDTLKRSVQHFEFG